MAADEVGSAPPKKGFTVEASLCLEISRTFRRERFAEMRCNNPGQNRDTRRTLMGHKRLHGPKREGIEPDEKLSVPPPRDWLGRPERRGAPST